MGDANTELIQAPIEPVTSGPLLDMRRGFLSMTPENMGLALAEYDERRKLFRDWLKSKLVPGTHYGFVPGCEPKEKIVDGVKHYGVWSRGKDGGKGEYKWYPESQWTPKPSLYKPTADMLCEMLAFRDEYDADMDAWHQLGEPKGTFVMRCRLFSLTSGELIGEGRGIRRNGQKGGDENNAIKMAKKSAKLDAIINALGISDLFTQDMDIPPEPPQYENPSQDETAPHSVSRDDRVTREDCKKLFGKWVDVRTRQQLSADPKEFEEFVEGVTGMDRADISQAANWTREDLSKCVNEIETLLSAYAEPPNAKRGKKPDNLFGADGGEAYDR